jgi:hypothetical protein
MVSETTSDNGADGAGVGGGTSDGVPGRGVFLSSPPSPSSFSGSSPPSAEASFVSPFRLRRRLRFFLTSPPSSTPSADSALTGDGVAGEGTGVAGATVDDSGVVCTGRGFSAEVVFVPGLVSTACDSGGDIEPGFLAKVFWYATSSGAVGVCAARGVFPLNHRSVATTDTNVNSSVELDGTHEDRWGAVNSGTLASQSHDTSGAFPSFKATMGSLPAVVWKLVFPGRVWASVAVGREGGAEPGTPSRRRARRERLSETSARTPVKHRRSVLPS